MKVFVDVGGMVLRRDLIQAVYLGNSPTGLRVVVETATGGKEYYPFYGTKSECQTVIQALSDELCAEEAPDV